MKRLVLLIALMAEWVGMGMAQGYVPDTIYGRIPNYFYDFWPIDEWLDTTPGSQFRAMCWVQVLPHELEACWPLDDEGSWSSDDWPLGSGGPDYWAQRKFTDHPIRIVGLAIAQWRSRENVDFKYNDSVMLLKLDAEGNMVCLWRHLTGYKDDSVRHVMSFPSTYAFCGDTANPYYDSVFQQHVNVYEYYMDTAIVVADSFYVGYTWRNSSAYDHSYLHDYEGAWAPKINTYRFGASLESYAPCKTWPDRHWWYVNFAHTRKWYCDEQAVLLMWPIIDTSYVGVESPDEASGSSVPKVYPNPADEEFGIYSPSPIRRVWIHDQQGRFIYDYVHNGTSVRLNTKSWPQGVYIVNFQIEGSPEVYTHRLVVSH